MNQEIALFTKLVPFLGRVLGQPYEVLLFDVSKSKYPIIASANSKEGTLEKAREFVRSVLELEDIAVRDQWTNHPKAVSPNKLSKMSVFLVRNRENEITAALVICMKCEDFFKVESFLSSMLQFNNLDIEAGSETLTAEREKLSDREPSLERITEYIREFGVDPGRTNHDEKSEIICDLYDMGVYNLKGAVAKTAQELGISVKSVYRYLSKIRKARE